MRITTARPARVVSGPHLGSVAAELHFARAVENFSRHQIPESLDDFHEAERLGYDPDQCASRRWECWMLLGDFERAWCESEAIARRGAPDPNRFWDGRSFTGKRVILRCLHGFGDAIQFIRYAPLIRRECVRLIVETHAELVSLFRPIPSINEVITWGEGAPNSVPEWDQQIEIMELPRAFRTTLQNIPAEIPYIPIDPRARDNSRSKLDGEKKRKIGLLWASSKWNPARSVTLAQLKPLLNLPDLAWYSFQRGPERDDLRKIGSGYEIHDIAGYSREIADAAADLANMDLVITVDTMLAHLAGALGKQVWTLLPYHADWRWLNTGDSTPWYPTMRLFRQSAEGDWGPVVEQVASRLSVMQKNLRRVSAS